MDPPYFGTVETPLNDGSHAQERRVDMLGAHSRKEIPSDIKRKIGWNPADEFREGSGLKDASRYHEWYFADKHKNNKSYRDIVMEITPRENASKLRRDIKVCMYPLSRLVTFLSTRGLRIAEKEANKKSVYETVEHVLALEDAAAQKIKISLQTENPHVDDDRLEREMESARESVFRRTYYQGPRAGKYRVWEQITTKSPIIWSSDQTKIWNFITAHMESINVEFMKNSFRLFRPNVLQRALARIHSGNFDLTTLKLGEACLLEEGEPPVTVLTVDATASMKSKVYTLYTVWKKGTDTNRYHFMKQPTSMCPCPNGALCCSHMIAFLELLRQIALSSLENTMNLQAFIDMMPDSITSCQGEPIPLSYYVRNEESKRRSEGLTIAQVKQKCLKTYKDNNHK